MFVHSLNLNVKTCHAMHDLGACVGCLSLQYGVQVLRSLGLMADMDIDELENLAQRVEIAKHQVRCPEPPTHYLLCQALLNKN